MVVLTALSLGYEIGRAIKYVGGSIKNVDALFKEAKKMDAILVFDQASVLFSSSLPSSQHTLNERNAVLYQINKFPGVVVLICDKIEDLDYSLFRRINFVLEFGLPEEETRERLWRRLIPDQVPLGDDVDLTLLAHRFHFTGGNIMNAIVRAAERASLRQGDGEEPRRIGMADLLLAAEEEARHLAKVALPFYKTLYM
ncbi:AAA family ATPase [Acanthamoeba castellanii str. Neff]|uniref:AAA family ATPase n=1 Tax=Acanthamoeba castellanii (strain ATCC 30010 / Neff) TaxID=1257118 RepID=L8GHI2_ACACF|nr:AAA family ATPase [Acanthamoeba castellanii str. Neff]ELR12203.1 AAA family ATPase [Acanthamoeba castellanii str. Neff]